MGRRRAGTRGAGRRNGSDPTNTPLKSQTKLNTPTENHVEHGVMKSKFPLAITSLLIASSGLADAAPWNIFRRRAPEPPRHEEKHDHRDRDRDDRNDRYRGHDRLEKRAQARLRDLGFYRGPIDGDFGRGSRAALSRFQHSRGLRATGTLTDSTIHALRL